MALLVSSLLVVLLQPAAHRWGWVDRPDGDPLKIHATATPLVGGLAIATSSVAAAALAVAIAPSLWPAPAFFLPAVGVVAVGFADDLWGLSQGVRFLFEAILAILVPALIVGPGAGAIVNLSGSVGSWLAIAGAAVLVVVGAINALNMQDGIDGLAGTLALVALCGFAVVGSGLGRQGLVLVMLVVAGATIGFLPFNLPPASVFLGDSGSYFLGFVLGVGALVLFLERPTVGGAAGALLLVGVPVLDGGAAVVRRLARGQSPLWGDRGHFYDLLLQRGWPVGKVLGVAGVAQVACVGGGVFVYLR
ncbi:MAG TPA: MraY family glycosyltransferase [Thermoanaerobaculia bacterium]|nr:MraY family glycosyltransferase [Thermoanaerobaculia bacterium]